MTSPLAYYRRLRISRQLALWFLLIALAPFASVVYFAYRNSVEAVRAQVINNLVAVAQRQADQIDRWVLEREQDVVALSRSPALIHALISPGARGHDLEGELFAYTEGTDYDDAFLVAPNGTLVFALQKVGLQGVSLRSAAYRKTEFARSFDRAITLLDTEISDFEPFPGTGELAKYIVAPVFDQRRLVGAVVLQANNQEIARLANDYTGLGRTGETVVARAAGEEALFVLPPRHNPEAAMKLRLPLGGSIAGPIQHALRGRRGVGVDTDYRGVPTLAAWRYLPNLRWGIVVKIDVAEALAPVGRLRALFLIIGVLTPIFVVLAALAVAKSISQPIVELTKATERMQEGDLRHRIEIQAQNELGTLAGSFNEMAEKLDAVISNLDALVAARTAELENKNEALQGALRQLKEMQQQLVQQEKMVSLGGLTAGIAHEIKNPLNFVNNFAELARDLSQELRQEIRGQGERIDGKALGYIEDLLGDLEVNVTKIAEHGKRADSIVRGMLLHSRGTPGERQPTDLNALLDEYVNLAYHGMRAQDPNFNVTIEKNYDPAVGLLEVVPQDLSRVFLNIVNNACYSTREKKRSLGDGYEPTLRVETRRLDGRAEVRIRDNGQGIPQEIVNKVFNPFFTTKPTGQGTGLGLSMSYDIVVSGHGGELAIETEAGSFAEFIVRLPYQGGGKRAA